MERRPKVLHVGKFYPPYHGGMETHLHALCRLLRDRVDLEVVVSNTQNRTQNDVIDGVPVTRLATIAQLGSTAVSPKLIRYVRETDADIVHIHWPNPMAIVAHVLSRSKAALVVSYHSDVIRQRMAAKLFDPLLEATLLRSDAIIVASPNYIESSSILRRHQSRCRVIPFGIGQEHFDDPDIAGVARIREKYGSRTILTVGRLVSYKGIEYLIRAMKSVNGKLLIAGDGPLRSRLNELSASLGLQNRVVFLGSPNAEELRRHYHAADIFVLASVARSEAFGLVQAEAMAASKPVINTALASGVPFVSQHGHTGITVPPGDSTALAEAINKLLDDDQLRLKFAGAARLRAEKVFRAEVMTSEIANVYDAVLERRRESAEVSQLSLVSRPEQAGQ